MSFPIFAHVPSKPDLDATDAAGSACFAVGVFASAVAVDRLSRRHVRAAVASPVGLAAAASALLSLVVACLLLPVTEYAATGLALVLGHPYLYGFTGTVGLAAYVYWSIGCRRRTAAAASAPSTVKRNENDGGRQNN